MAVSVLATSVDSGVHHILCGVAILTQLAAFELGIGVPYYPLASRVFEPMYRDRGMVFVIIVEGLTSTGVNFSYPVVVNAFSQPSTGQAVMFTFFAAVGVIGFVALKKWMQRSVDYG